MNRRNLFKGLLAMPIAALASKLGFAQKQRLQQGIVNAYVSTGIPLHKRFNTKLDKLAYAIDSCATPVFGEYIIPIHPFDFYDLMQNKPAPEQVGLTGIPVSTPEGVYLSSAFIYRVDGKLYMQTSTVEPSENCSLR